MVEMSWKDPVHAIKCWALTALAPFCEGRHAPPTNTIATKWGNVIQPASHKPRGQGPKGLGGLGEFVGESFNKTLRISSKNYVGKNM